MDQGGQVRRNQDEVTQPKTADIPEFLFEAVRRGALDEA
jgi:hypothetical protein